jgi:hypothetical protein
MKKLFLFLSLALLTLSGCSNDDDKVYGPNATIVGFANAGFSKSYLNNVDDADLLVPVTFVSFVNEQLPTQDISMTWEVVASTDADAAVPGVDFDLPAGGSGVVVIPAGQTTSSIQLNVHPSVLSPDTPKKLTLLITSASNSAIVGKQYEKIEITLQGICVSSIDGMYDLVVTVTAGPGVGNVYNLPNETVTKVTGTDSRYKGSSIAYFNNRGLISASAQSANNVGLVFEDTCGNISLWKDPDWHDNGGDTFIPAGQAQYLGQYYNPSYQTSAQVSNSFVNDVNGVITIEYNLWFASGTRSYLAVYTPQ